MAEAMAESGRATATVLFTDLVGSTELRSRLGEQAAEELRRRHDQLLTATVELHHGRVVKGLGDGVMATFAGASEGVAAAVAIQQAVDRDNRSGIMSVPLSVRVGLSAGDVSFEDGDSFGTPVIEAARLCAAARGGQILASEMVRWLARGAGRLFSSLGTLELKGLPEPVPVCEVGWEPLMRTPVPLPPLLTDVGRVFVGRREELDRLDRLWKEAVGGDRRVGLVAGEPGVGKTRLSGEVARKAHEEGATVLAGRCDEDLGVPFQPFVEALRHLVDHVEPRELPQRLGRYAAELERLVPSVAAHLPDAGPPLRSDPETERYRLFEAVTGWLAATSAHEPVLMILDDLQWAAKPTLLLLRHIARSPQPMRLLMLGTYRDTELHHDHPLVELLADLRRHSGIERVSLTGLDQEGVADFMARAAGHEIDDDGLALARAIHAETEGNPFFVGEILRHLAETQAIVQRDGRWFTSLAVEEVGIPEGVREVVGRRVSRLSNAAARVLRVAAVVGAEFELAVVERVAGFEREMLFSAVEEAITARLVVETSEPSVRCRFTHALVRDTLYQQLSGPRRVALHREVADAIEAVHSGDLDDYLPALTHHWTRAAAPAAETARAVGFATRAGDRALAQLAHDEAVGYYSQAVELREVAGAPYDSEHCELLISLGRAQRLAGDPAHRETLLDAARLAQRNDDAGALGRAALANTRGHLMTAVGVVDEEKVAALEAAVVAVGDHDLRTRARLLATLGLELVFARDWRRCLALSDEALALARRLDDPETLASVLVARFFPAHMPWLLDERLANTAELLAAVEATDDPALASTAHLLRGRVALEAAEVEEADRCFAIAERISAGLGQPALRFRVTYPLAGRAIAAGRFADAERLMRQARDLGYASRQQDADWIYAVQLFSLRLAEEHPDEEVVALLETEARRVPLAVIDSELAVAACALGREREAQVALDAQTSTSTPFDQEWILTMTNWATVAAHLGATRHTERLADALRPYAGHAIALTPQPAPSVAHHLGLLSLTLRRYDEADTWFAAAGATHERLGAPHWLARTRMEHARTLTTRRAPGDAERARQLAGQALATSRTLGLHKLEREAGSLLQELA